MTGFEKHLTNEALAERLRKVVDKPRSWPKAEREALILEAAFRLDNRANEPVVL